MNYVGIRLGYTHMNDVVSRTRCTRKESFIAMKQIYVISLIFSATMVTKLPLYAY